LRISARSDGKFERDLIPTGSHRVVVPLGNEDHSSNVQADSRNGRRQQWERKRIERCVSEPEARD
jgi:hypothetical protein